jgi:8-oxo-dGTP pyrophosphatase MutT (NUDIX family)
MPRSSLPVRDAVSAGGVVWRRAPIGGDIEVVLCGRHKDQLWVLPKGTPDAGESMPETAVREVQEETGLRVALGEQLPSIDYWFVSGGQRIHKRVHHWLMEPTGGSLDDHDAEFDVVEWVEVSAASAKLKYPNERKVVAEAARMLGVTV